MSQNIPLCPNCGKAMTPHPMFGLCQCDTSEQVTSLIGVQPQLLRDVLRLLEDNPLGTCHDVSELRRFHADERRVVERIKKALGE